MMVPCRGKRGIPSGELQQLGTFGLCQTGSCICKSHHSHLLSGTNCEGSSLSACDTPKQCALWHSKAAGGSIAPPHGSRPAVTKSDARLFQELYAPGLPAEAQDSCLISLNTRPKNPKNGETQEPAA